jgi:nucleoside-diphosphate-sugar epimerase
VALDGGSGLRLCRICERIAAAVPVAQRNLLPATSVDAPPAEIAVLGGTGFIGRHLVTALVAEGRHITVLARNTENLPPIYSDPHVRLVAGDIGNPDDVRRGIGTAKRVVNLAHGGGGGSRAEIEKALVGGAQVVADVCLELGVERLVFISSIASLFLGNPNEVITGATPVDRNADSRADYARAKAMAEEALLALHRERGLPLCILRPGVVVGADGLAFHSGVGYYNRDRHCLGWNDGRNPLPFVLAEDVAAAIVAALERNTLAGTAYNLVGDVRLSAREYIHELGRALGRDLRYHPQSPLKIYAVEFAKWLVKRAAGRRDAALASLADLRSRGLAAAFDCSDAKRDLGWVPVADRAEFVRRGIAVNAEPA